jgi:hypothetical protein
MTKHAHAPFSARVDARAIDCGLPPLTLNVQHLVRLSAPALTFRVLLLTLTNALRVAAAILSLKTLGFSIVAVVDTQKEAFA